MKNYLPALALASCCFCFSCHNKIENGLSAAAQKNLETNHAISKCFDTKDFSRIGDYIAADAVDHSGEGGDIRGLANMKVEFQKYAADIDQQQTDIIKELADDEYVMSWGHFSGNYKTAAMGHKAGDHFDMKALDVVRFKDGKAVEHWMLMEPAEAMKMMNTTLSPAPTDSTTKKM